MNKKTLTALKQSIAHHERMAKFTKIEQFEKEAPGWSDCALCQLFIMQSCVGCPVDNETHTSCQDTPYEEICDAHDLLKEKKSKPNWQSFRKAERAEIKFLKSLLPKEK